MDTMWRYRKCPFASKSPLQVPLFCIKPTSNTHSSSLRPKAFALCFFILNFKIQIDQRLWDIVSVRPMVTKPQHFSKLGLLRLTWGKLKHYSVVLLVNFITNDSVVTVFFPYLFMYVNWDAF